MDAVPQPTPKSDAAPRPNVWKRLLGFDSWMHSAASLSIVTLLAGWIGTYVQYLNSYEQTVNETAKLDMTSATETFVNISNAFAQAQMLQQLVYNNYKDVASEAVDKEMSGKAAKADFDDYMKARNELRQNVDIYARKAELYIDWASNLFRDPAETKAFDGDPLTESVLKNYNFDCDSTNSLPVYDSNVDEGEEWQASTGFTAEREKRIVDRFCKTAKSDKPQVSLGSETIFCARTETGEVDHSQDPHIVNWTSAKHHLLVMHYCFEHTHNALQTPRMFASGSTVRDDLKQDFNNKKKSLENALDLETTRLDQFLSLVMSQLERIRVKYRPSGPYCHFPVIREVIGLFSNACTPIRIAKQRD